MNEKRDYSEKYPSPYPYVQYSAKLHTHTRGDGKVYSHSHRTWPTFHGHDGLPVIPGVEVVEIPPER